MGFRLLVLQFLGFEWACVEFTGFAHLFGVMGDCRWGLRVKAITVL